MEDATGDVLWGLADHEGTIRDLVDSTGTVQEHRQYDTFGRIVSPANRSADFPQAFTGRPLDADTDLYDYRARWYDPAVGRFASEDPSGFAGGDANLYRYAGNSPLVNVDPSGLCFTGVAGLLFPGMDFGGDHRSVRDSASSGPSIGADDRSWLGRWWDKIGYRWSHREPLISDPKAFRDVEINGRHYTIANDQGGWTDWLLGNLYHRLGLGGAVEQILRYEMDPIAESYQQAKGLYDFVTNFHRIPEIWDAMPDYQRQDIAMQLAGTGAGMGAWRVLSLKPTPVYSGGGGTLGTWMLEESAPRAVVPEVVGEARFGPIKPQWGRKLSGAFGELGRPTGSLSNGSQFGYTDQGIYWEQTAGGNVKYYPQGRNGPVRIQYHPGEPVSPGQTYNPRHHGEHWHVETKIEPNKQGWGGNTFKTTPPGYTPGSGTGFLPGEPLPEKW